MISNKVLTIDDALEILQEAKEKYGNLPLEITIGDSMADGTWDVKDIIANEEYVTIYNY